MSGIPEGTTLEEAHRRASAHLKKENELLSQVEHLRGRAATHSRWAQRYHNYAEMISMDPENNSEPKLMEDSDVEAEAADA